MRKSLFFVIILCLSVSTLFAQKKEQRKERKSADSLYHTLGGVVIKSNKAAWNVYDPERGFFQKAHTDKGDPRFMISNEDESFKFGIGGFVTVVGLLDFNGLVMFEDFATSQIPVPGKSSGQFALNARNSRINTKVVGKTKYGDIIAFIETDFRGDGNALRLRHAYISYFGFTVGQTWSTFMDLEAGPPNIDMEGPNTQISIRQPMIRYSCNFTPKLSFSVALEMNSALVRDYETLGIRSEFQKVPDIPFYLKYKDDFGHIQLGAIFRSMNYLDDTITHKSLNQIGYGVSLSGKINFLKKNYFYFQGVYGAGIAQYIQDLSFANMDMVLDLNNPGRLRTLPMFGFYASLQRDWMPNLYSAIMYGFTMLQSPQQYNFDWLFSHTHYFAVNLFWDFIPYGTVGIEYLFGKRVNKGGDSGIANRIDFIIKYGF